MVDSNLIKLAVDGYNGRMSGNYSVADSQAALRNALIEANGGKTTFNIKDIRDGKCNGVFAIIEELVNVISEEGLKGDEFFNSLVETRNLALGDTPRFHVEHDSLFVVSNLAEGTQGARRQRIEAGTDVTVNTSLRAVKIYEELNRVMAGRVDFNKLVDTVSRSFTNDDLDAAYAAFTGLFAKLAAPYLVTGSFDEEKMLDLIEHVEAATGGTATIIGTRKALRKVTTANMSDEAKTDLYSMGYMGRFFGVPMVAMKQRHAIGTTDFILDDNSVYVFTSDSKPIKRVIEGDVTMLTGDPLTNADLSQEFMMIKRSGIAVVTDRQFGTYKFS